MRDTRLTIENVQVMRTKNWMREELKSAETRYGPWSSTRIRTNGLSAKSTSSNNAVTATRIVEQKDGSPSVSITDENGIDELDTIGHCDDRSDDYIVSLKLADLAVDKKKIGVLENSSKARLAVALKSGNEAETF